MRETRSVILGVSILAGILVLSALVVFAGNDSAATVSEPKIENTSKTLTSHDPITINGNADFSDADDDGVSNPSAAGTQEDPYIIENWDINASGDDGIDIENTDAYFIIRNCVIHDGKSNWKYGIYFYNVQNGKIDNVTSYNNYYGIYLLSSSNNNISNCYVYNNSEGIWLSYYSNNNQITNCTVYNNYYYGIYLWYSSNNNITNCTVYNNSYGIRLSSSSNNEIHYCNIYNNTNYGIYNWNTETEYLVNATYNYWGSADGPGGVGLGNGDAVSQNVLYNPWLTNPLDFLPPTVESTQPSNGAIDVPVDAEIVITFSEPMNISTISGNITIKPTVEIQNYAWSNNDTILTITFSSNLSSYTLYTITINTNVKDNATVMDSNGVIHSIGNHLQSAYQFSFRTKDIILPEITNVQVTPSVQEVYGYVNITAMVSDNVMINGVYVNIAYPNGTLLGNFSMIGINLDANRNGTYYCYMTYSVLGTYSYYIWADDISGNQNKSATYQFIITTQVQDTTKPVISNVQANPSIQTQGGAVNITCAVIDDIEVSIVKISITGPTGFNPVNTTMTKIAGTNDYYYNSTYSIPDEYYYYIWANDTSNNQNSSSTYQFTITVSTVPIPISVTITVDGREVSITSVGTGTINVTPVALPPAPPENLYHIGIQINVTITGTLTYANITIKYNDSDVANIDDESKLRMYYWNETEGGWKSCDEIGKTGVDIENKIVWANVTHLTIFVPMAEKVEGVAPPVNWFLYAGVIVIIILVLVCVGISIKRKRKAQPPEKPA